jgi:hypothetical protein
MARGTRAGSHRLSPAKKNATINRVNLLESELFDNQGHLQREISQERAIELLDKINALRYKLGWLSLDLKHHPVWPDKTPQ